MRRLIVAVAMLMLVPAVAAAGGGGVDTSGCAGFQEGVDLSMRDSCFAGTTHFAPSDRPLTVSNDGELPHTLTAVDGSFDTGQVAPGSTTELSIDEPGIYLVFCSLHGTAQGEGMAGVLVVGDAVPASVAAPADTAAISAAPPQVTVGDEVNPVSLVVLLVAGLAAGLALSALLMVMGFRIAGGSPGSLDRLEPSIES